MEVGQSGSSFVLVHPDPDNGPQAYIYCLGENNEELRSPTLDGVKPLEAEGKRLYGEVYILHQTDRVVKKL